MSQKETFLINIFGRLQIIDKVFFSLWGLNSHRHDEKIIDVNVFLTHGRYS